MRVKLVVIQGKPLGKVLTFPLGEFYFGRGAECQVRPNSEWISRQHCLLRVTAEGAFLRDLGSRNGTLVNGVLLEQEKRLTDGDKLELGPLVFQVMLDYSSISSRRKAAPPPEEISPDEHRTIAGIPSPVGSTEHLPSLRQPTAEQKQGR